jgi:methanogenic corrinoid protein MtbC1
MRARGSSIEVLLLHLLAPTARLLGDLWKEDLCSFGEVTVGLSRLQQLLRELSSPFENEIEHVDHGRRAMLAAAPGEQHTFGITVVEEFLRRGGWDVWSEPSPARGELVGVVRGQWFDVVGLSLSSDILFDDLGSTIDTLRRASLNRAVRVMVGGRLFIDHPELVLRVGADATAVDGRDAVHRSRHLVDMTSRLC